MNDKDTPPSSLRQAGREEPNNYCLFHKSTGHATRNYHITTGLRTLLNIRNKARKEGLVEPKDKDKLDKHTYDEDQCPTKKPTFNINCIYRKAWNPER
ncbi:hypothetical protein DVH24_005617 [Malus domestica]|uniref:Uncharacterized protein n=1 Tax=Malus domestica TaxID=3750 RepID=A0A498IME7_MALDO|nr:hypothetical protein DVH24_005617 [Malus domestica]